MTGVPPAGDARREETITAFLAGYRLLAAHLTEGWFTWFPDGFAGVTGAPLPTMNGVVAGSPSFDAATAAVQLERVRARGVPYSLTFPARDADALAAVGAEHGLTRVDDVPLFRVDELAPFPVPAGVGIRHLDDGEASVHAELAAVVFGAPASTFDFLLGSGYVAVPGVRFYVATLDGEPVGTGLGVTHAGATAVFNVATVEAGRGRGVGAALTHRIVADGRAHGARFAFLQPSPLAAPLYRRLGFAPIDDWQVWVSG